MSNGHRWMKRLSIGGVVLCVLLAGCLFLCRKSGEKTQSIWRQTWHLLNESEKDTNDVMSTKKIALTFDDGPHPVYTPMLLDGLEKRGVKATFFLIGTAVENYPEVAKRIADEGHLIGNHTYHHVSLENADEAMIEEEVVAANQMMEEVTGQYPQLIRPPFGQSSSQIEVQTDMICVLWTIDPLDWCTTDAATVAQRVLKNSKENGIILLHDEYKTSVMAAFTIIDELQKKGYEFVTVDELLLD